MPKGNGDGEEPPKMVISKPTPMADLKIKKNVKKTEKRTVIAQAIHEVTPTNNFFTFVKLLSISGEQLFLFDKLLCNKRLLK